MAALASALLQWLAVLPDLLAGLSRLADARERQARALERLADAAETYCRLDPKYWEEQARATESAEEAEAASTAMEAEVQTPAERQLAAEQLATFQMLLWQDRGEWLEGDALVETFEREWQEALGRQQAQMETEG